MEKYVLEAFFLMNDPEGAIKRIKKQYDLMLQSPFTTLWELFEPKEKLIRGRPAEGTYNHGWSGGPLTLLCQYAGGIAPETPGYGKYHVKPQLGELSFINITVPSVKGLIKVEIEKKEQNFSLYLNSPANTIARVSLPVISTEAQIVVNGKKVFSGKKAIPVKGLTYLGIENNYHMFQLGPGEWKFVESL